MTDLHDINREAHRIVKHDYTSPSCAWYAEKFADTRDALIKEGWTPPDEARELAQLIFEEAGRHHEGTIDNIAAVIRPALAKARSHPAEVVEAAKRCQVGVSRTSDQNLVFGYILK